MSLHLNATFSSWQEFQSALSEYEKHKKVKFVKGSSRLVTTHNASLAPGQSHFNEELKYQRVVFCCKSGERRKSESTGMRPNQRSLKLGCKAQFTVLAELGNPQKLRVSQMNSKHENHPTTEEFVKFYPEKRRLNDLEQETVKLMTEARGKPMAIRDHVRSSTGKAVTMQDLANLQRQIKKSKRKGNTDVADALGELECMLKKDPGSKSAVGYQENSKVIDYLYFQTSKMAETLQKYPEVVGMDTTYKVNKNNMHLVAIMCIDNHGKGRVVGYCFLRRETSDVVEETLKRFKEANSSCVDKIRTVIVDKDYKEINGIKKVLPNVHVHLCHVHVMRTIDKNSKGEKNREAVKKIVRIMSECGSKAEFDALYIKLQEVASANFMRYFNDNWKNITEAWILFVRNESLSLNIRSTNHVESHNAKIKSVTDRCKTVGECIRGLLLLHENTEFESAYRDFREISTRSYVANCSDPEVEDIMETVVLWGAKLLYKEWMLSNAEVEDNIDSVEDGSCSCGFFIKFGMKHCRHIFHNRRCEGKDILSKESLPDRWLKPNPQQDSDKVQAQEDPSIFVSPRSTPLGPKPLTEREKYNAILRLGTDLASLASQTGGQQFQSRLEVLKSIITIWESRGEVAVLTLNKDGVVDAEIINETAAVASQPHQLDDVEDTESSQSEEDQHISRESNKLEDFDEQNSEDDQHPSRASNISEDLASNNGEYRCEDDQDLTDVENNIEDSASNSDKQESPVGQLSLTSSSSGSHKSSHSNQGSVLLPEDGVDCSSLNGDHPSSTPATGSFWLWMCKICGDTLERKLTKSDLKGNKDRYYRTCPQGCKNSFRWDRCDLCGTWNVRLGHDCQESTCPNTEVTKEDNRDVDDRQLHQNDHNQNNSVNENSVPSSYHISTPNDLYSFDLGIDELLRDPEVEPDLSSGLAYDIDPCRTAVHKKKKLAYPGRFKRGIALPSNSVEPIDEKSWYIDSATTKGVRYIVTRMNAKCKSPRCEDIAPPCMHRYTCGCMDKANPCQHTYKIHSIDVPNEVYCGPLEDDTQPLSLSTGKRSTVKQISLTDFQSLKSTLELPPSQKVSGRPKRDKTLNFGRRKKTNKSDFADENSDHDDPDEVAPVLHDLGHQKNNNYSDCGNENCDPNMPAEDAPVPAAVDKAHGNCDPNKPDEDASVPTAVDKAHGHQKSNNYFDCCNENCNPNKLVEVAPVCAAVDKAHGRQKKINNSALGDNRNPDESEEVALSPTAVDKAPPDCGLTLADKKIILSSDMLLDSHMALVSKLIKCTFPDIDGLGTPVPDEDQLKSTILTYVRRSMDRDYVQIMYNGPDQWITFVAPKGKAAFYILDSSNSCAMTSFLEQQVSKIVTLPKEKKSLRVNFCEVQSHGQSKNQSGPLAVAIATEFALTRSLSLTQFSIKKLIGHLLQCLLEQDLSPFPKVKTKPVKVMGSLTVSVYCICRMPEHFGTQQIFCSKCREWFHYYCMGLSKAPEDRHWECNGCLLSKTCKKK